MVEKVKNTKSLSHEQFVKVYEWLKEHSDYLAKHPAKREVADAVGAYLQISVSVCSVNSALKTAGLWYEDRRGGTNGRPGPRLREKQLVAILLAIDTVLTSLGWDTFPATVSAQLQEILNKGSRPAPEWTRSWPRRMPGKDQKELGL